MNRLIVMAAFLVACGGVQKRNVEACENFNSSLACGEADVSAIQLDCSVYEGEGYDCDISDYFNCLADNVECDEANGIVTLGAGSADCAASATCE